jgi:6-phosphogluconolactonase (cycloisomerase 2 family)
VTVTCTTKTYTLSGTITGLSGSGLALQTNGTNIPISGSAFSVVLASGTPYSVTVTAQPSTPTQNCVVGNGTGTITNAPISNVTVVCTTRTFTVSGTISGLAGTGLVLQTSGTNVPITGSAFSVTLASGTAYNIRATTQPSSPTQNCVPANNTGTVTNANINNVTVTCTTTNFTVSGTISGLTGSGLVLQTNATPVTITSNTFSVTLASGTAYAIIAQTQPQSPAQYCVVTNGTGTVAGANVTNVVVGCRNQGVYAFVADSGAATVSAFNITSNSGLLTFDTAASTPVTTSFPSGIAVEVLPAGATYLYTADFNTADIAKFSFDPTTLPQPTVAYVSSFSTGIAPATSTGPGSTPTAITIDPTGQFVLVADSQNAAHDTATTTPGAILVFAINQTTGDLTPATGGLSTATAIAPGNYTSSVAATVIPADTPYVFATNQFAPPIGIAGFSFNNPATSGTLTQLAPWQATTGNNPVWVTVDPLDRFVYVSNSTDGTVSGWVLGTDGTLTAMPGSPFGRGFSPAATTGAIAIDPTGRFLYVTDLANNQVVGFTIDQSPGPTAGALTAMTTGSPFATGPGPFPVNVDPSGHFVYVGNTFVPSISMFTADPNTGILTPVGGSPLTFGGVSGRGANAMAIE